MLSLKCDIEIKCKDSKKTITFDYCNDILIKTSCKNLTDTAVLKVPRKMQWQGKALTDFVNVDDAIIIKLGYAEMGNMEMVFKGYIKSVENTIKEIVIYCENEMRLFKSINVDAEIIEHFDFKKWMKKYVPELRTRTAKQWTDFTSDPTANMLYPNLKWLPSRSANRREEHIPFYGLVLPKTDEFWQHNQPGNLWNCKCDWEETDEQPSSYIPKDIYAKGLEGNPAQTGQIFTDKASYINRAGKKVESYALKITRKDNLDWAMETLKGKKIRNEEFNRDITFTGRGIKDYINQPIDNPILKNEAIRTIPKLLKKTKYLGYSDYKASNTIRHSHIFEITLANKKQWIIIHEYANNDIAFYSISNNQNVLIGIKKENTQPLE